MRNVGIGGENLSAGLVEVVLKNFTPKQVARELENSMEIICDNQEQRIKIEKTIKKLSDRRGDKIDCVNK